jgi:excisionase family DNA binding protein
MTYPGPYLTVREAAELMGRTEETVRRQIRDGSLPAVRVGTGPKAPWGVPGPYLERRLSVDAHKERMRKSYEAGGVVGRGEEFLEDLEASPNSPDVKQAVRETHSHRELFDYLEREMREDPAVRQRLETLDEEERIEVAAQELARRVREHERIQRRALEILEEDDEL